MRSAEKSAEDKEENLQVDFENLGSRTLPTDDGSTAIRAKAGHWVEITHTYRANNYQFVGEFALQPMADTMQRANLDRSLFSMTSTRPVLLPRGQLRQFETICFLPRLSGSKHCQLQTELRQRKMGRLVIPPVSHLVPLIASSSYFFLVLAENADDYGYLSKLASISLPYNRLNFQSMSSPDFIVSVPDGENGFKIPSSFSVWTSTAYVLWDDVLPDSLTSAQQTAMVDWLHWGGHLIVTGKNTLDLLRGSFLDDYLPAEYIETMILGAEELTQFNEHWSPSKSEFSKNESRRTLGAGCLDGIGLPRFRPVEEGYFVPNTSGLVVERRVGRGRVCCVALPLADPTINDWEGFDGFFNACILRRPGRKFEVSKDAKISVRWRSHPHLGRDARINCGLRFFSRDFSGTSPEPHGTSEVNRSIVTAAAKPTAMDVATLDGTTVAQQAANPPDDALEIPDDDLLDDGAVSFWRKDHRPIAAYMNDVHSGVAGWNDFSDVAQAARQALQRSAGVQVPDRRFVAKVLAVYLVCLVPINWLLFRLAGKLEWAWMAAPLIAIVGTLGVVKLAQLDVGFIRSRTELTILETQPDYLRGHLTRFCGLYTSLATRYELEYDDEVAVFLPFSMDPSANQLRNQQKRVVRATRRSSNILHRFPVISNSTGMVHSEEMRELPGPLRLTEGHGRKGLQIENLTGVDWHGALLIGRRPNGVYAAYLGTLEDQISRVVEPQLADRELLPTQRFLADLGEEHKEFHIISVWKIAVSPQSLAIGQWRLVAWRDGIIDGVAIQPGSSQEKARNLLIAHLRYGVFADPVGDANQLPAVLDELYDDQEFATAED